MTLGSGTVRIMVNNRYQVLIHVEFPTFVRHNPHLLDIQQKILSRGNEMEKEKDIVNEKKQAKDNFLQEYNNREKQFKQYIQDIYKTDKGWSEFAFSFVRYRVWLDLEFKSLSAWIEDKFEIKGTGKTREIEKLRQRIIYLAKIGNPQFSVKKKNEKATKTDYEKAKAICDKLNVDDLMALRAYVESLLSAAENIEEEEKEVTKIKRAA